MVQKCWQSSKMLKTFLKVCLFSILLLFFFDIQLWPWTRTSRYRSWMDGYKILDWFLSQTRIVLVLSCSRFSPVLIMCKSLYLVLAGLIKILAPLNWLTCLTYKSHSTSCCLDYNARWKCLGQYLAQRWKIWVSPALERWRHFGQRCSDASNTQIYWGWSGCQGEAVKRWTHHLYFYGRADKWFCQAEHFYSYFPLPSITKGTICPFNTTFPASLVSISCWCHCQEMSNSASTNPECEAEDTLRGCHINKLFATGLVIFSCLNA